MERLFDLDWQLIADSLLTIVAVGVLFFFMSYFLFDPVRKLLTDRQSRIKTQLDEAENNMEQAAKLREAYEVKLKDIRREEEEILGVARRQALANESEIIFGAREEAGRIVEKAHREALLEKQKLADDIKKEIIAVAAVMSGKIITATMNAQIQDQLIEEALKEIGEGTWLN